MCGGERGSELKGAVAVQESMNTKPQCLLVHRDSDFLAQLKRFFHVSRPGYDVVTFTNGADALEHARGGQIAIIVTSYLLPQIDGLHFISSVRAFDASVPIVMISDVPVEVAARSRGATAFVGTEAWWAGLEQHVRPVVAEETPVLVAA